MNKINTPKDTEYKTIEELEAATKISHTKMKNQFKTRLAKAKDENPDFEWERKIYRTKNGKTRKRNGYHFKIQTYLSAKNLKSDTETIKNQYQKIEELKNDIFNYQYQVKTIYDELKSSQKKQIELIELVSKTIDKLHTENKKLKKENEKLTIKKHQLNTLIINKLTPEELEEFIQTEKETIKQYEEFKEQNPLPELQTLFTTPKESLFPDLTTKEEQQLMTTLKNKIKELSN